MRERPFQDRRDGPGAGARANAKHLTWPQRVYYQHTDAAGVVYHGNYLDFMECARTELMQSLGFDLGHLARDEHLLFMVHSAQITYHRPARLNDMLLVGARLRALGRARLVFAQEVKREEVTLVSAEVTLACVDARTRKPIGVPEAIRRKLEIAA
jgi:acyl-CoA thioester hydrolase